MQIIPPGGQLIPPRKKFHEVVGTEASPLVKPLQPKRLKIIADTAIRGTLAFRNSVFEFDVSTFDGREDYSLLLGCLKAVKVDLSTPLHVAPAPVAPPPLPAKQETPSMKELIHALTSALKASKA